MVPIYNTVIFWIAIIKLLNKRKFFKKVLSVYVKTNIELSNRKAFTSTRLVQIVLPFNKYFTKTFLEFISRKYKLCLTINFTNVWSYLKRKFNCFIKAFLITKKMRKTFFETYSDILFENMFNIYENILLTEVKNEENRNNCKKFK